MAKRLHNVKQEIEADVLHVGTAKTPGAWPSTVADAADIGLIAAETLAPNSTRRWRKASSQLRNPRRIQRWPNDGDSGGAYTIPTNVKAENQSTCQEEV